MADDTDLTRTFGTNWTPNNVRTLINWLNIASFTIKALEKSIFICRSQIRLNTILGLVLSTASGSISVTQYSGSYNIMALNILFTVMSFMIAITTGYIKIYQIQERLEIYIKTKQEWTTFVSVISTEMDLPIPLRQNALYLISTNKEKYLNLMNVDFEIFSSVKKQIDSEMVRSDQLRQTKGLKLYDIVQSKVEKQTNMLLKLINLKQVYDDNKSINVMFKEYDDFVKSGQVVVDIQPDSHSVTPEVRFAAREAPETMTRIR
jgi:hypothetical protein